MKILGEEMLETELYKDIINGAARAGLLLTKIVDGSLGKKPFDMFGVTTLGLAVAIEVKVFRKKTPLRELPKELFESQQLTYLHEYAKRGAISLALIYRVDDKSMLIYDFREKQFIGYLMKHKDGWGYWGPVKGI